MEGEALPPGAVSIVLAISAFFISKRNRKLVGIFSALTLFTICILTRPGPFDLLFQLPYLNWFMVVYALPALLLFIAILAGAGYDSLLEEKNKFRSLVRNFLRGGYCNKYAVHFSHIKHRGAATHI